MNDMDEIVKEFLVESYENLDRLDRDFVALETESSSRERLSSIFRTIHTIKGTCGFLGFSKLEKVAHVGENLLSKLRDGQLTINTEITTALLKLVDAIREILGSIESTGREGDGDYTAVTATLVRLNEDKTAAPAATPDALKPAQTPEKPASVEKPNQVAEVSAEVKTISPAPAVVVEPIAAVAAPVELKPELVSADHGPPASIDTFVKEQASSSLASNAIRVDVGLLDRLMNLVGELVLARNQVLQLNNSQNDPAFHNTTQNLNLITTELQESVMKTRMQPIGGVWDKLPRVVRDLSQSCGKKVRLEMEGRETELDKTILEAIKDPLTHIVRNSIDHGVESPQARAAKGKPEEGRLFMRAYHEGGQVNIEISDDGGGIDPERVKRKAIEKGLITSEQAGRMPDRDAVALIFLPGFSTAEKVTNVSGRGVGMDVVKTNVEKIGGTVDVQSKFGEGTCLKIKIPLTLAIVPALVVKSAGDRFAIPQVSLLELVRLDAGEKSVEYIGGAPVFRLRGDLLPLVYLNTVLKNGTGIEAEKSANIVVLRAGERQFGLVVDQVIDTGEIVVKPLSKQLKGINVFAGATIMGDGRVALILDVMGLAQKANVISQSGTAEVHALAGSSAHAVDRQVLLLFTVKEDQRMAIPLSTVARLEEFACESIEEAGGQSVVQYRGQIMPLINVAGTLHERRSRSRGGKKAKEKSSTVPVVVYNHENRTVGLRVEQILDVVEEHVNLQAAGTRPGVLGTAVIKEKVHEILDLHTVVTRGLQPRIAKAA
jgi:two-component system chemotaxis sensor kinase CheA